MNYAHDWSKEGVGLKHRRNQNMRNHSNFRIILPYRSFLIRNISFCYFHLPIRVLFRQAFEANTRTISHIRSIQFNSLRYEQI